ncbi:MAG: ABC transporter permease [Bacteriovoracaceae bacterium]
MKNFAFLLKYSLRNLKRNPKRTIILFLALTFSSVLVVWAFNVNKSGVDESIKEITAQYVGKYQASHKDFDLFSSEIKLHKYLTEDYKQPGFENLAPRAITPVFISGLKKTIGALMVGVDPERELKLTKFSKSIIEGNYFSDPSVQHPIILGQKLAHRLDVKLGEEVVVIGQGLDGSMANDLFVVVGLFDVGGGDMEEKFLFTTIPRVWDFISMPNGSYHSLVGMDDSLIPMLEAKNFKVLSWKKLIPDVFVSFDFLEKLNFILTIIMVFVVSLGVSNTLFVSFNERQKEIHSLNTIGANSLWIMTSLMIETFSLLIIALVLGSLIASLISYYFNVHPIDLRVFSGNQQMMVGGMEINSFIRVSDFLGSHIKSFVMITSFVSMAMIYPIGRVIKRSKRVS